MIGQSSYRKFMSFEVLFQAVIAQVIDFNQMVFTAKGNLRFIRREGNGSYGVISRLEAVDLFKIG
ncbi:hypothetical protein D3C85_1602400 [compost metagenome]